MASLSASSLKISLFKSKLLLHYRRFGALHKFIYRLQGVDRCLLYSARQEEISIKAQENLDALLGKGIVPFTRLFIFGLIYCHFFILIHWTIFNGKGLLDPILPDVDQLWVRLLVLGLSSGYLVYVYAVSKDKLFKKAVIPVGVKQISQLFALAISFAFSIFGIYFKINHYDDLDFFIISMVIFSVTAVSIFRKDIRFTNLVFGSICGIFIGYFIGYISSYFSASLLFPDIGLGMIGITFFASIFGGFINSIVGIFVFNFVEKRFQKRKQKLCFWLGVMILLLLWSLITVKFIRAEVVVLAVSLITIGPMAIGLSCWASSSITRWILNKSRHIGTSYTGLCLANLFIGIALFFIAGLFLLFILEIPLDAFLASDNFWFTLMLAVPLAVFSLLPIAGVIASRVPYHNA